MLLDGNLSPELQTMLLLNLYACYTARNAMKHHLDPQQLVNISACMLQFARQGTFGHSMSRGVLSRWIAHGASSAATVRGRH